MPAYVDFDHAIYGTRDLDGLGVKAAPDFDGPPLDARRRRCPPRRARARRLARAFLAERFPALADAPLARLEDAAATSSSPDAHFVAAPHPEHPSVWLLGGGSGHGFKHGPAMAERVAAALRRRGARCPRTSALGDRGPGGALCARLARRAARRRRVGAMHDYLIVGAGSAGCALAARLTEDPDVSVLLVEAGPPDSEQALHIPVAFSQLYRTPFDWDYRSGPEPALDGRELYVPRGRVLGGSSSLNAMIYIRGNPLDYAEWGPGWGWDDVLPYFKRAEDNERGADALHGAGGPLSVERRALATTRSPRAWVRGRGRRRPAAPTTTSTGREQDGVGFYQLTQRGGMRCSAAVAYLHPALARPNLTLVPGALVTRVLFEGDRAVGRRGACVDGVAAGAARRARGGAVRRRLQHAAAADAVGHRPGRAPARARRSTSGSTSRRSARTCPTTSTPGSSCAPTPRR